MLVVSRSKFRARKASVSLFQSLRFFSIGFDLSNTSFDNNAKLYSSKSNYQQIGFRRLLDLSSVKDQISADAKVHDQGAGTGLNSIYFFNRFLKKGHGTLLGTDISEKAVEEANRLAKEENVDGRVLFRALPAGQKVPELFDLTLSIYMWHWLGEAAQIPNLVSIRENMIEQGQLFAVIPAEHKPLYKLMHEVVNRGKWSAKIPRRSYPFHMYSTAHDYETWLHKAGFDVQEIVHNRDPVEFGSRKGLKDTLESWSTWMRENPEVPYQIFDELHTEIIELYAKESCVTETTQSFQAPMDSLLISAKSKKQDVTVSYGRSFL